MSAVAVPGRSTALVTNVLTGAVGGVAGGVVFGVLMQAWGMLPMVAMLVGSESVAVGWLVHLFNSALFGVVLGLALTRIQLSGAATVGVGLAYGALWWVLGALLIMPAWLGMNEMVFQVNEGAVRSLLGHLAFGAVLGAVLAVGVRRRRA